MMSTLKAPASAAVMGTRLRAVCALAVVMAAAALLTGQRAAAQVSDVEPFYIEVTRDNVNVRSGDGEIWYAVGQAPRDAILRVDGQGFEWLRVSYPANIPVLVRADEAELTNRGTVRLTRATRMRAYNRDHGVVNSWKTLLDASAPAGLELRHVETLRSEAGDITGYLVEAPDNARAFISERLTNRISDEEARARLAALRAAAQGQDGAQRPGQARETPAQIAQTPDTQRDPAQTEAQRPAEEPRQVAEAPAQPRPEERPAQTTPATGEVPGETTETAPRTTTRPVTTTPAREDPEVLTMGEGGQGRPGERLLTLAELREAFDRVIAQPIHAAELQPLIDEHTALLDSLREDPREENTRRFLQARIELLKIRAELQSNLDRLDEVESRADRGASASEERLAEFMARPEYVIVGRLSTSAIYDGKRLPLLYRITSVEDGAGRTLAYLAPDDALDLNAKLGAIVGVVGERRGQQGLRAAVLAARRVDVLSP